MPVAEALEAVLEAPEDALESGREKARDTALALGLLALFDAGTLGLEDSRLLALQIRLNAERAFRTLTGRLVTGEIGLGQWEDEMAEDVVEA
jgi:hypothetical protein